MVFCYIQIKNNFPDLNGIRREHSKTNLELVTEEQVNIIETYA